jgi:predicted nucleic acid binding AN1-type Zn finger protein
MRPASRPGVSTASAKNLKTTVKLVTNHWTVHATSRRQNRWRFFPLPLIVTLYSRLQVHKVPKMNIATAGSCIRTRSSVKRFVFHSRNKESGYKQPARGGLEERTTRPLLGDSSVAAACVMPIHPHVPCPRRAVTHLVPPFSSASASSWYTFGCDVLSAVNNKANAHPKSIEYLWCKVVRSHVPYICSILWSWSQAFTVKKALQRKTLPATIKQGRARKKLFIECRPEVKPESKIRGTKLD